MVCSLQLQVDHLQCDGPHLVVHQQLVGLAEVGQCKEDRFDGQAQVHAAGAGSPHELGKAAKGDLSNRSQ